MRNFREILVWQKGISFTKEIYAVTNSFPDSEKFGIISQIRRASVSISSNIAEGASRNSDKDFKRFLEYAIGSGFEIETQLIIAKEIDYIKEEKCKELIEELHVIQKMLNAFIRKLKG